MTFITRVTALAMVFASSAIAAEPAKPAAPTPKPYQIADGWKVEVLAQKPAIHYPSVVCPAPDGRIFLAEDPMDMKGSSKDPEDRILVIHPDGKITVFAEHLYAVFGLQYLDGKLFVHHTPKLSVFTDKDSVGVERIDLIESDNPSPNNDGHGFNDHIPSNLRLGMDGYLYVSTGDKGIYGAESSVDHSKAEIPGGGIMRLRPDGSELEAYCTGTRNHLDVAINSEDELFTYDNTDDGNGWWTRFTHMVDGGFYGYPYDFRPPESEKEALAEWKARKTEADKARKEWETANKDKPANQKTPAPAEAYSTPYNPWTLWRMEEYGGGSPTGSVAYNEGVLPVEFHGNIFASEWGKGNVERFVVERRGGTYCVTKREILLRGGPETLKPVGIQITEDGTGILVADWNYSGWRNANTDAGRLLKLTYTGKLNITPKPDWYVPAASGKPFEATTKELIAALSHPAESVRLVAQRRIADRGTESVAPLIELLKDANAFPHAKWHAIWALDRIDGGKAGREAIIGVLKNHNNNYTVRMQAARELGTRRAKEAVSELLAILNENDEALRFRAATALGRIGDPAAVDGLIRHLDDTDLFTHFANFKSLNRIASAHPEAWEPIIAALNDANPRIREGAILAMRETYDVALVKSLAGFVTSAGQSAESRAAAITVLAPLQKQRKPWATYKWWGTQPARNAAPAKDVEWDGTKIVKAAIRSALGDSNVIVRHAAVQGLKSAPDPEAADALSALFESDRDAPTRKAVLAALAAAKAPSTAKFVAQILADPKTNEALVAAALDAAEKAGGPNMLDAMLKFVDGDNSPALVSAGLETLAKLPDVKSLPILIKRMTDSDESVRNAAALAVGAINDDKATAAVVPLLKNSRPEVKRAAADAMAGIRRESCLKPLLDVWNDKDIKKEAINALASRADLKALDAYLEGLSLADNQIRNKCHKAIESIHEKALPLIEARLDTNPLPTKTVAELKTIYERFIPADQRKNKLFQFDTRALAPEAFLAFAKSHPGDAANGRKIFGNANGAACIKCHKVGTTGGDVGPNLDGVGGKYPRDFLIDSILYPSKQILDGYQQTMIRRKSSGLVETGIVRGDTDVEVTLVDANAQKIVVKKDDIALRKLSNLSLMPEGLHLSLKPEEFADLVAFLESLKEPAKK